MHWWFGKKSQSQIEKHLSASRRGRRFGRISRKILSLAALFLIYFTYFGTKMHFHETVFSLDDVEEESKVNRVEEQLKKPSNNATEQPRKPHTRIAIVRC